MWQTIEDAFETGQTNPRECVTLALTMTLHVYQQTTEDVTIWVRPFYLPRESRPDKNHFVFVYEIQMTNHGAEPVQLRRRKWIIRDGNKVEKIVEGEGVVGQTPVLGPGENFQYSSYCALPTPSGSMRGHFLFFREKGTFLAEIPLFFLRQIDAFVGPSPVQPQTF